MSEIAVATAGETFAGEGRKIGPGRSSHSLRIVTANDWTFSVVWGFGTYCSAARQGMDFVDTPPDSVPDAEVACWKGDGPFLHLDGDDVAGWVRPDQVLRAIEAAEADDREAIRAALTKASA